MQREAGIVIKGDVNRRVGGQMVKGKSLYWQDRYMNAGFKYMKDVDLEVDGTKAKFADTSVTLANATPREKVTGLRKIFLKNNFFFICPFRIITRGSCESKDT